MTKDPVAFLPNVAATPDDTFTPPKWFLAELTNLANTAVATPKPSPFRFKVSASAAEHNASSRRQAETCSSCSTPTKKRPWGMGRNSDRPTSSGLCSVDTGTLRSWTTCSPGECPTGTRYTYQREKRPKGLRLSSAGATTNPRRPKQSKPCCSSPRTSLTDSQCFFQSALSVPSRAQPPSRLEWQFNKPSTSLGCQKSSSASPRT